MILNDWFAECKLLEELRSDVLALDNWAPAGILSTEEILALSPNRRTIALLYLLPRVARYCTKYDPLWSYEEAYSAAFSKLLTLAPDLRSDIRKVEAYVFNSLKNHVVEWMEKDAGNMERLLCGYQPSGVEGPVVHNQMHYEDGDYDGSFPELDANGNNDFWHVKPVDLDRMPEVFQHLLRIVNPKHREALLIRYIETGSNCRYLTEVAEQLNQPLDKVEQQFREMLPDWMRIVNKKRNNRNQPAARRPRLRKIEPLDRPHVSLEEHVRRCQLNKEAARCLTK